MPSRRVLAPSVFVTTLVIVVVGSLLHFAYEWSGRLWWVGIFAATNESTWEHLKLAFWPTFALASLQRLAGEELSGELPAFVVRCTLPSLLIVAGFYGYTALVGRHLLAADIALFVVAVFAGEAAGASLQRRPVGLGANVASTLVLIAALTAFSTFTSRPPGGFLFEDPSAEIAADAV